ncbi:prepilin-type N-terminal cleavage/methylation domain protein [Rubidibacter lacunae KORDI 51-2]|uniref:Prepilin-type N-terminal cleavage/methylation domain protein n=1 Tax=Rubidibacter lacunae KORDI 51-2 TaxID=582515 RepID=U5DMP1_9CHRO|nr:type IV pilin-like G/H family protein [Rubidibacter lacunae]ERN42946.1 prepilin-type N-terminal cleavage/methylation domain protein [Rubidibacter lacunae KORDI 51-2]
MKAQFQAKLLQLLARKSSNKGFTLIELLVVIIIIAILSAIALPNFLNQADKARASEAQANLGVINRAQQAYRLDNPSFAANFDELDSEVIFSNGAGGQAVGTNDAVTNNWTYEILPGTTAAETFAQAAPSGATSSSTLGNWCGRVLQDGTESTIEDNAC